MGSTSHRLSAHWGSICIAIHMISTVASAPELIQLTDLTTSTRKAHRLPRLSEYFQESPHNIYTRMPQYTRFHCLSLGTRGNRWPVEVRPHSRASNVAGHILAAAVLLPTGDGHTRPRPAGARPRAADDHDVVAAAGHGARSGDVLDREGGDGDVGCGRALEVPAVVVLLDEDAVPVGGRKTRVSTLGRPFFCARGCGGGGWWVCVAEEAVRGGGV